MSPGGADLCAGVSVDPNQGMEDLGESCKDDEMASGSGELNSVVIEGAGRRGVFAGIRSMALAGLAVLLMFCLLFSWRTRDAMEHLPFLPGGSGSRQGASKAIVDLHTWQTAQALAPLAISAEEVEFAREAERLADHETDQAFACALRLAVPQKRTMSAKAQVLTQRIAELQAAVAEDQRQAKTASLESGGGVRTPLTTVTSDGAAIAAAQMGLDTDELKDAQEDLAREVGDERTRIQQELSAHEAAMRKYDAQASQPGEVAVISAKKYGTLAGRLSAWQAQRSRRTLLEEAAEDARRSMASLTAQHDAIEGQADRTSSAAQGSDKSGAGLAGAARLRDLTTRSAQRQLLGMFDDRIETVQQLAGVYGRWSDQVALQHRIIGHLLLQSIAEVVVLLMAMIVGGAMVRRWMDRSRLDRRRMQTLRTVVELGVQVVGIALILLVIFGAPKQTPTILGLTTAGLTVVLQDFILAFFGWFVLMGKNGISVGDAVEIDGVSGDVVEIGLFRTTMLETGNWTAQGHPTGRRVAIINKFAINGQYFNFSTAGQFLWDEITIEIGAQSDPYARLKEIEKAVQAETSEVSQMARAEWQRSERLHAGGRINTGPEVNLRPSAAGLDVLLRYVTRASQRVETRNRLYGRVLSILHGPETFASGAPAPKVAKNGAREEVARV